jgi:enolase
VENYLKIESLKGRMILDSRGYPTVEAVLKTKHYTVSASVPSGASTGSHEAHELRDGGKRWDGKGVEKAIASIARIEKALKGELVVHQERIDQTMLKLDGTPNKSKLGSNAMLAVSIACAKAAALHSHTPLYRWLDILSEKHDQPRLPVPFANVINGGVHASNALTFQEFMIAPIRAKRFLEAARIVSETYHALRRVIIETGGSVGLGDEGGFAPQIRTPEEALELLEKAIARAGHTKSIMIAIDVAASEFYDPKTRLYDLAPSIMKPKTSKKLIEYYAGLCAHYPIISIEDPFHEDDFGSFAQLIDRLEGVRIVADDLTVTNSERIATAIEKGSANTLLLKVNQIGTLTEAIQAYQLARNAGWDVMVSHRSGETEDHFIADLAVGLGTGMIKLGAPARAERTAKYNQLLRIENTTKLSYGLL